MKFVLLTTTLAVLTKSKVAVAQDAATDVVGRSFKLHEERPLKAGLSSGIRSIFKDLSNCLTRSDASGKPTHYSLITTKNEEEHSTSKMFELGIKGSGSAGAFVVSGSLDIDWSKTTMEDLDSYRSSLDVYALNESFELNDGQACRNVSNLNEHMLYEFGALPVGKLFDPHNEKSWANYASFFDEYGSHLLVQATTGARFIREGKTKNTKKETIEKFKAKLCVEVQSADQAVLKSDMNKIEACIGGGKNSSDMIYTMNEDFHNYALGGAPYGSGSASSKIEITNNNKLPATELLTRFIQEASLSVTPVRYRFEPIWETLYEVYNTPCLRSERKQEDENCKMLQRARTLEAHYEGKQAYQCHNKHTPKTGIMQRMIYANELNNEKPDPATGVQMFACWNGETGCKSHDDCHAHWVGAWHRHACFMYGQGAVSYEPIPFSEEQRDVVIESKEDAPEWADQVGNNYCSRGYVNWRLGCKCDTWIRKPARPIYVQRGHTGATIEQIDMSAKGNLRAVLIE